MVKKQKSDAYRLGRTGGRWRAAKARVFRTQTHCHICGQYVDQSLPHTDPMSRTVDHVIPLHMNGAPLDPANLRLAHRKCNGQAGQKTQPAKPRHWSREW